MRKFHLRPGGGSSNLSSSRSTHSKMRLRSWASTNRLRAWLSASTRRTGCFSRRNRSTWRGSKSKKPSISTSFRNKKMQKNHSLRPPSQPLSTVSLPTFTRFQLSPFSWWLRILFRRAHDLSIIYLSSLSHMGHIILSWTLAQPMPCLSIILARTNCFIALIADYSWPTIPPPKKLWIQLSLFIVA